MTTNLEQQRAEYALTRIKRRKEEFKGDTARGERYLNRVKSLPATIITCGLGQTMATLLSVGKGNIHNPDQMLYEELKDWLCCSQGAGIYRERDLIDAIVKNSRRDYIQAQAEALKLTEWLKKLATAYLSNEVRNNDSTII